jgi:hypothetical protein
MDWSTAISGIETGQRTVPPDRLLAYADALAMEPRIFMARVLKFTHPHAAALLLGTDPREAFAKVLGEVPPKSRVAPADASCGGPAG